MREAKAQVRKLELELSVRGLGVLGLRSHLHGARAKAEYLSAEVEIISAHLAESVVAQRVAEGKRKQLQRQVDHNMAHYQRCLEDLVEETVDLAGQRNVLSSDRAALQDERETLRQEVLQLRTEVTRLREQRQAGIPYLQRRQLELFAEVRAINQETMDEAVRLERELAVRNGEISILRVSEELLQLKVEEAEQRLAAYRENNSRVIDRLRAMSESGKCSLVSLLLSNFLLELY